MSAEGRVPAETDPSPLEPVPVAGCDVCGALGVQRETARAVGRLDTVRACNRELAGHPHRTVRQGRRGEPGRPM